MLRASRIIWWVNPHSLSYQAITLTSVPSTTTVSSRSTTAARGSGMDGRHHRALHPEPPVSDLDHGGDAVRRTARARDDLRPGVRAVDAMHYRRHGLRLRRRGQDHVRRAGLNMLRQRFGGRE